MPRKLCSNIPQTSEWVLLYRPLNKWNWKPLFCLNFFLMAFFFSTSAVTGLVYAIEKLISNIHTFHVFAPCYQCPQKPAHVGLWLALSKLHIQEERSWLKLEHAERRVWCELGSSTASQMAEVYRAVISTSCLYQYAAIWFVPKYIHYIRVCCMCSGAVHCIVICNQFTALNYRFSECM